jgi:hypothetical protein
VRNNLLKAYNSEVCLSKDCGEQETYILVIKHSVFEVIKQKG